MRVNIYAEEMTDRIEIIGKEIDGHRFTGLRFYLELPCTVPGARVVQSNNAVERQAQLDGAPFGEHTTIAGPFMHRPGDDDSAAVTFWGKRDLRTLLRQALAMLDEYYGPPPPASTSGPTQDRTPRDETAERIVKWLRGECAVDAELPKAWREPEAMRVVALVADRIEAGEYDREHTTSSAEPGNADASEGPGVSPAKAWTMTATTRPTSAKPDADSNEGHPPPEPEDRSKRPPGWPVYSDGEIMCIDGPTHADCIERAWTVYDAVLAPERKLREAAERRAEEAEERLTHASIDSVLAVENAEQVIRIAALERDGEATYHRGEAAAYKAVLQEMGRYCEDWETLREWVDRQRSLADGRVEG